MNEIKYAELWKGWKGFIINGVPFEAAIGIGDNRECFIIISPDYNPSARYIVCAIGLKRLEKKLNKIEYKIIKGI